MQTYFRLSLLSAEKWEICLHSQAKLYPPFEETSLGNKDLVVPSFNSYLEAACVAGGFVGVNGPVSKNLAKPQQQATKP